MQGIVAEDPAGRVEKKEVFRAGEAYYRERIAGDRRREAARKGLAAVHRFLLEHA